MYYRCGSFNGLVLFKEHGGLVFAIDIDHRAIRDISNASRENASGLCELSREKKKETNEIYNCVFITKEI